MKTLVNKRNLPLWGALIAGLLAIIGALKA